MWTASPLSGSTQATGLSVNKVSMLSVCMPGVCAPPLVGISGRTSRTVNLGLVMECWWQCSCGCLADPRGWIAPFTSLPQA